MLTSPRFSVRVGRQSGLQISPRATSTMLATWRSGDPLQPWLSEKRNRSSCLWTQSAVRGAGAESGFAANLLNLQLDQGSERS